MTPEKSAAEKLRKANRTPQEIFTDVEKRSPPVRLARGEGGKNENGDGNGGAGAYFGASNTVLLDNHDEKFERNPAATGVVVAEWAAEWGPDGAPTAPPLPPPPPPPPSSPLPPSNSDNNLEQLPPPPPRRLTPV